MKPPVLRQCLRREPTELPELSDQVRLVRVTQIDRHLRPVNPFRPTGIHQARLKPREAGIELRPYTEVLAKLSRKVLTRNASVARHRIHSYTAPSAEDGCRHLFETDAPCSPPAVPDSCEKGQLQLVDPLGFAQLTKRGAESRSSGAPEIVDVNGSVGEI
jgi:hypothetical protein